MTTMKELLATLFFAASCGAAHAVDFHFDGYADLRLVVPSSETSWMEGGLGKLRYGANNSSPEVRIAEVVGQASAQITPALMALAVVRVEDYQRTFFDLTEAYLRYRPVSTTEWRWWVKGGFFFVPVSLENTQVGWTSPWTLTPSAINTWVGEELRNVGAEGHIEWRTEERTIGVTAAVYGWNDPTGILVADRGWALTDRVIASDDLPRLPDAGAIPRGLPLPQRTHEFLEIDGRAGYYGGVQWDEAGLGHVEFLHYDNIADPRKTRIQVGWRTRFNSVGLSTHIGEVTFLAQAMTGNTFIYPSPFFFSDTDFMSAYLLAGWDIDPQWRVAGRVEYFGTHENHTGASVRLSEHGNALTAAVNYLPYDWLRLTAEVMHVTSTRTQRTVVGDSAKATENQVQFSAKFYLPQDWL